MIEYLRSVHGMYSDSVLAIFLSGSLALAIVIVSLAGSFNASLFSYLFGSILSVSTQDLWVMGVFGSIAMALLLAFFKELYFIAFDEDVARAGGHRRYHRPLDSRRRDSLDRSLDGNSSRRRDPIWDGLLSDHAPLHRYRFDFRDDRTECIISLFVAEWCRNRIVFIAHLYHCLGH
jgi:hypothetical protein